MRKLTTLFHILIVSTILSSNSTASDLTLSAQANVIFIEADGTDEEVLTPQIQIEWKPSSIPYHSFGFSHAKYSWNSSSFWSDPTPGWNGVTGSSTKYESNITQIDVFYKYTLESSNSRQLFYFKPSIGVAGISKTIGTTTQGGYFDGATLTSSYEKRIPLLTAVIGFERKLTKKSSINLEAGYTNFDIDDDRIFTKLNGLHIGIGINLKI
ncbi:hypothetical protein [Pelagicoccus sp. SDUM812002]|uniref:hypothetical protein n=1 Tax=Pelagicoccus sp. SDUM812002 TaxID=3041266 RepID=UPI00280D9A20|nr:hypothetical protein [Pelagicoccus sp. SDUM812002]MDQ8188521.1 hypothetical protein [Pelagicoccus sp. SDUM812002]